MTDKERYALMAARLQLDTVNGLHVAEDGFEKTWALDTSRTTKLIDEVLDADGGDGKDFYLVHAEDIDACVVALYDMLEALGVQWEHTEVDGPVPEKVKHLVNEFHALGMWMPQLNRVRPTAQA